MTVSSSRYVVLGLLSLSLLVALQSSAGPQQGHVTPQQRQEAPQRAAATKVDEGAEGEKRFRTNCGRCHHPPEDLSPREARAVIRQMRVRAMLTAEDERLILKFLAP